MVKGQFRPKNIRRARCEKTVVRVAGGFLHRQALKMRLPGAGEAMVGNINLNRSKTDSESVSFELRRFPELGLRAYELLHGAARCFRLMTTRVKSSR